MGKKYKIIYADPPWQYRVYSKKGKGRSAENHYHTMNIDDIRSLPVGEIADDDCVLFLWITFPCLKEGISVMESWMQRWMRSSGRRRLPMPTASLNACPRGMTP